jgi:hypothetical protein
MAGRETGDPEIKIGHLNGRSHCVRPPHLRLSVRWLIFAAWIAGLDAAPINWTIAAREGVPGPGSGPLTARRTVYHGYDGSKREQLGIPGTVVCWTRAEIAMFGTDTDRIIARLLGRTEVAVRVRRKKSKIPAYR